MRARVLVCLLALFVGVVNGSVPASAQSATASISGVVTTAGGEPLQGVCVEAFTNGYGVTTTAADGSYTIGGLEAGSYTIAFNDCADRTPGYAPEYYDDAPVIDEAELVTVGEGEARTGVDAALAPTGSFSGTVVDDESGEPLAGVCVSAFNEDFTRFVAGRTGDDGGYVVEDVPAGSYILQFEDCAAPLLHIPEFYDDVPVEDGSPARDPQLVVVTSDEDTAGIDAGLAEGGAVSGTVLGLHTGQGQPFICVGLFEQGAEDGAVPQAITFSSVDPTADSSGQAAPGEYVFGGVAPGTYVVGFNPGVCGDDGYPATWWDDQPTREQATPITVTQGEVTSAIDAVVTPLPGISFACPAEVAPEDRQFDDVPEGNVHAVAIECLALFDIVLGRSERTYNPAQPVTRAQLASFVARTLEASGLVLPADPPNAFDDDNGSVHEPRINQLAAIGVVRGVADRRYAPAETVNRGQMASFLVNAYERATDMALQAPEDRFADDDGSVHEANINKAATAGITAGTGSGYAPGGVVRRDQMASFLARLLDRVQRDLLAPGVEGGEGGEAAGVMAPSSTSREPAGLASLRARALSPLQRLAEQATLSR